jgi:tetratricopeptide (TPR) repeat protein/tRNA A-37 threonylcarbamoyl transferase component Bud32
VNPAHWKTVEDILASALELPAERQAAYVEQCCADSPEIRKEVEELLAAYRAAEKCIEPRAGKFDLPGGSEGFFKDTFLGTRIGTYKLVERIGDGGMGTVYRAERDDGQFTQVVAVKLVRAGLHDPELLKRLRTERQILALLEHPHIARLLDGGITASGQPYIVMEYIEGARITDYCKSHNLTIRQRLTLFRQICSAVHYAHQRLVVHRDIKPSNILVAKDGTPKLLDFGIAKIVDSSAGVEGHTLTSLNPMTPEYASPEQIQGKVLTTATDIYSLGVLLYELLTYQKPYKTAEKTPQEVARLVCESEPQKPSTASTAAAKTLTASGRLEPISGDLDHIVLKAMRKEPAQRYASAEELSADIGNYLGGLPVQAREGSFRYRAGKFVARYKAATALSSALFVALVAGLILVSWQVHVARVERARAQRRFNDVRKLANSLIFEVHDGIRDLPGSTPVRKLVISRAAEYLDSLAKDAEGDIGLQIELSAAYMRLGEVQLSIGTANLGDRAGANASYQKAEALLHSVLARDRFNVTARRNLAACYEHDASLYELRTPQAQGAAGEALKISQELVQERPNDETLQKDLARALHVMAIQAPSSAERVSHHTQELEIYEKLLALHPESFELQRDTALAQKYIASDQLEAGLDQPAIEHLQAALALDSKRAEANPNNAQAQLDASFDMSEIGYYYMDQKKLDAALQNFQQALQVRRKLLQLDPENHELQGRVAYITKMVADVLLKMGKNDEALKYYRSLADLATALVAKDAGDTQNRSYLGFAYNGIATAQDRLASGATGENKQEYRRQACAFYRKSYEVFRPNIGLPGLDPDQKKAIKDVTDAVTRCSK